MSGGRQVGAGEGTVERYPTLSKGRATLIRGLASGSVRAQRGLFVADGIKLVGEALAGRMPVVEIVATPDALPALDRWADRLAGVRVSIADAGTFAGLVESAHPQGVLAVIEAATGRLDDLPPEGPILVLDRLQDPGNAGTLLRSFLATGGRSVIALSGTVALTNPKVVRASAGALFHLAVAASVRAAEALDWLSGRSLPFLALHLAGRPLFDPGWEAPPDFALAVGNEGAGLDPLLLRASAERLVVPMAGGVESLNAGVAGSVALFELARRRADAGVAPRPA